MRRSYSQWMAAVALLVGAAGRCPAQGRELVFEVQGLDCPLVGGLG